jgi:hypothetical protein
MSAEKTTLLRAFNNQFFDFLSEIIRIFPENREIKDARTTFELIKKANPTAIIKVWQIYVYEKYKDVIETGNLDFFFEKDYSEDLVNMANANEIMKTIDIIRGPIKSMSVENKATSLEYIKILCKLSNVYSSFSK